MQEAVFIVDANLLPAVRLQHILCAVPGSCRLAPLLMFLACCSQAPAASIVGSAQAVGLDIYRASDGVVYDAILLTGATASIAADAADGQRAIVYFLDPDDDLVAVEIAGPGTLTLTLADATGPALPVKYNRTFSYMKGRASLSVIGFDATTQLYIYSVGPATSDLAASAYRTDVTYDGVADITWLTLIPPTAATKFGSLHAANARFSGTQGVVGISAQGSLNTTPYAVAFTGVLEIGDLLASGSASPSLRVGITSTVSVVGGALAQPNGRSLKVAGFPEIQFVAGQTSHRKPIPAQPLGGELESVDTPPHPVFVSPNTITFTVGAAGRFRLSTSGTSAATYRLKSGLLPPWATLDATSGAITGTPSSLTGSPFTFVVEAVSPGGDPAAQSVTLTVVGPVLPVITSVNTATAIAGQSFKFTVQAAGVVDTYSASPLPAGLTFDVSSGLLSGVCQTAGTYHLTLGVTNASGTTPGTLDLTVLAPPTLTAQPLSTNGSAGAVLTLTSAGSGSPAPSYQWTRNGAALAGATTSNLNLSNFQIANAGLYAVELTNSAGTTTSSSAIVGFNSTAKAVGTAGEVGANIPHQNGNTYDQVLLTGPTATVTADAGQVTRVSYVDLSKDIVQVEFAGAGTLTLLLEDATAPAPPENYNQSVNYVKGHATLIITGANETTNVSVFSVGRKTAVNQALFRDDVDYDGGADLACIAISTTNGRFGGVRAANASCSGTKGLVGIYAPGVEFAGPVFIGNIRASSSADPVLLLGSASDARITGGDLFQPNARPVRITGVSQLHFRDGTTSHGALLPAQTNRARLEQDGVDVTSQVAGSPGS